MDREFANRKFAIMIEGFWMPGAWSNITRQQVDNIGFIPMFPVPDYKTSTFDGNLIFHSLLYIRI